MAATQQKEAKLYTMSLPSDSGLISQQRRYLKIRGNIKPVILFQVIPAASAWTLAQFGYELELTGRSGAWQIQFRSERDALLFKLFWY